MGQYQLSYSATDLNNMVLAVNNIVAPTYDSTRVYNVGDLVMYKTVLYECLYDNTTGSFDTGRWKKTRIITEDTTIKAEQKFKIKFKQNAQDIIKEYTCKDAQSWIDWVNSENNTDGFRVSANKVVDPSVNSSMVTIDGTSETQVINTSLILNDFIYITIYN